MLKSFTFYSSQADAHSQLPLLKQFQYLLTTFVIFFPYNKILCRSIIKVPNNLVSEPLYNICSPKRDGMSQGSVSTKVWSRKISSGVLV